MKRILLLVLIAVIAVREHAVPCPYQQSKSELTSRQQRKTMGLCSQMLGCKFSETDWTCENGELVCHCFPEQ